MVLYMRWPFGLPFWIIIWRPNWKTVCQVLLLSVTPDLDFICMVTRLPIAAKYLGLLAPCFLGTVHIFGDSLFDKTSCLVNMRTLFYWRQLLIPGWIQCHRLGLQEVQNWDNAEKMGWVFFYQITRRAISLPVLIVVFKKTFLVWHLTLSCTYKNRTRIPLQLCQARGGGRNTLPKCIVHLGRAGTTPKYIQMWPHAPCYCPNAAVVEISLKPEVGMLVELLLVPYLYCVVLM